MMIQQDNASRIFRGNVMGMEQREQYEQDIERQRELIRDEVSRVSQDINFNDRVMGGRNSQIFMQGKMTELSGIEQYTQRVNMLTGKGGIKMEDGYETDDKMNYLFGSSGSGIDKVNSMLGGTKGSAGDKINKILSGGKQTKSTKMNVDNYLGMKSSQKSSDVVNKVLGTSSKKSSKNLAKEADSLFKPAKFEAKFNFDELTGMGKRAFAGISPQSKINDMLGMQAKQTLKGIQNNKVNALNKINSTFGIMQTIGRPTMPTFSNPERDARKRMKQQKGLSMFGDFDGDRVLNAFDCNPVNKMLQGENDNLPNYMPGSNQPVNDNQSGLEQKMSNNMTQQSINIADLNNDGVVDVNDREIFQGFDLDKQISFAQNLVTNADSKNQRANAVKLLDTLMVSKRAEDKAKFDQEKWQAGQQQKLDESQLKTDKFGFEKEKWQQSVAEKEKEKEVKRNLGMEQLGFQKEQFGLQKVKYMDDLKNQEFNRMLTGKQFEYQQFKDIKKDSADERKDRMKFVLERQKLDIARDKAGQAYMETKLKAGQNLLGGLLGTGTASDLGAKVGSTGSGAGFNSMIGSSGTGANPQNMMMMSGGMMPSQSYPNKVSDIVGNQTQDKPFTQKVTESMSNKTAEELMKEQSETQQMMQQSQMAQPQMVQPVAQQPQMVQPVAQQPQMAQPQPMQARTIQRQQYNEPNWDELSPEEIAQYDPQYARYIAETSGEHKYRRGPYKKSRY